MGHLLDYDSVENEVLRALDTAGTVRLLQLSRISPLHTFVKRGGSGACDSLLYYAIDYKWDDGVALFMLHGGDPTAQEPHRPNTPLAFAQENAECSDDTEHGRYVLALLGRWAVDAPLIADQGATALMYAAEHGHAYAVHLLLQQHGANVHLRNPITGANALYYAMQRVDAALLRRHQRCSINAEAPKMDAVLGILVGPLDPVQYQSRFPFAMASIRRHANAMLKTADVGGV